MCGTRAAGSSSASAPPPRVGPDILDHAPNRPIFLVMLPTGNVGLLSWELWGRAHQAWAALSPWVSQEWDGLEYV